MIDITSIDTTPFDADTRDNNRIVQRQMELQRGMSIHGELPAPGETGNIRVTVYVKPGEPRTQDYLVRCRRQKDGVSQRISSDVVRAIESAAFHIALHQERELAK